MLQTRMSAMENRDRRTQREAEDAALERWILRAVLFLISVGMLIALGLELSRRYLLTGPGRTRDKHTMYSLASALSQFYTEYGINPGAVTFQGRYLTSALLPLSGEDLRTTTDAAFMRPLLGLDDTVNPRRIKFVDLPLAKKGRFGLTGDPPTLVDAWGQPYHVILDSNGDGRITNPEAGTDPRASAYITAKAIIYTSGPDRDPKTWKDNITTWR